MSKQRAQKRIEKLKKEINRHRYLYHVRDRQEISDAALDSLKHELKKLENQYPDLITPDSPTQRVGGEPLDKFEKVEHETPMLSLEDAFSSEELKEWEERIKRYGHISKDLKYFCELKLDGFAVSLVYKNGILDYGATRGNGQVGEDVTANLKTIEAIPLKLRKVKSKEKLPKKVEVRGEVFMTKKAFEAVNKDREKRGEPIYANPRNLAAGSIRQLDPKISAARDLTFMAYDVITDLGQEKHSEEHEIISQIGFKTDKFAKVCKSIKEVIRFWEEIQEKRDKLSYQIDGLVVTANDNRTFERLGIVGKAPRGSVAFKFPAEEATTVVKDIQVQVGRTGVLTPVAVLEPVDVGGVTVTRATLHNEDEIKRLDVRKGDTVIIRRAGDVIPDIVRVLKNLRPKNAKLFKMPKTCPQCGGKVIRVPGEAAHKCTNKDCAAIKRQELYHFVSRKAFDIDGLGPKIIDQLLDNDLIGDPADIFDLEEGDLVPLERFAEKSAGNLVESIENSKAIPLSRFIVALGIPHVGEETAIDLAREFGSIKNLAKASKEKLDRISDVGEVMAESIHEWFKSNRKLVDKLLDKGVKIKNPPRIKKKLKDKNFVLTGILESMTRDEAKSKIRLLGGNVSSSVSKNTDYLVLGEEPGSKYEEAKKIDVKIIKEKEFLKIIKHDD